MSTERNIFITRRRADDLAVAAMAAKRNTVAKVETTTQRNADGSWDFGWAVRLVDAVSGRHLSYL